MNERVKYKTNSHATMSTHRSARVIVGVVFARVAKKYYLKRSASVEIF